MKDSQNILSTVPFYHLHVYGGTRETLLEWLTASLTDRSRMTHELLKIYTPNPEQMVMAWENPEFLSALQRGDVLLPDGAGLVWGVNRGQGSGHRVQRIAGREIFHELLEVAKERKLKVFLLGGRKGSGQKIVDKWTSKTSGQVWEVDDGPKEQEAVVLKKIGEYKPDLLFVAYGAPTQELWIDRNQEALEKSGVRLAMVVGGAFEYEAGLVPRVSPLVQNLHLEWLQRLILEPWRAGRQLKGLKFFYRVIRDSLLSRL